MRILVLLLILINSSFSFSQVSKFAEYIDPGEKIIRQNYSNFVSKKGKKYLYWTFYVNRKEKLFLTSYTEYTDSALSIRDGYSILYNDDGSLYQRGSYVNNKEEGIWIYGDTLDGNYTQGTFINGLKTGVWKTYESGKLTEEYTYYQHKKNGEFFIYDSIGSIYNTGEYKNDSIEYQLIEDDIQPAKFPGCESTTDINSSVDCSTEKMLSFINKKIKYPLFAKNHGIQGRTVTNIIIENDGTVSQVKVLRGLCEDIQDEIIQVISLLPKFTPKFKNGKPMRSQLKVPIQFKLN